MSRSRFELILAALVVTGCFDDPVVSEGEQPVAALAFIEWAEEAGIGVTHSLDDDTVAPFLESSDPRRRMLPAMIGGIAVADVNLDGWTDIVVLRGERGAALYLNQANGLYQAVTSSFELRVDALASGPVFADFNHDEYPDLLLVGIGEQAVQLLLNEEGERFVDWTEESGLSQSQPTLSAAVGDADRDGDLDILFARYGTRFEQDDERRELLWLNDGTARFSDATEEFRYAALPAGAVDNDEADSGLVETESADGGGLDGGLTEDSVDGAVADAGPMSMPLGGVEVALSPNFVDLDGDGAADVALVQDEGLTQLYVASAEERELPSFNAVTSGTFDIPHGRGSAFGDYDNDGDLDWFISGVGDTSLSGFEEADGNRLYENLGDGDFRDVTADARVDDGSFGFGSCFADFNNDGNLDIFQVNGWGYLEVGEDAGALRSDASRMFLNRGDATFEERAMDVGVDDSGQGRGVACFDYDHDGDIDIVVNEVGGPVRFFGNTLNPWGRTGANYMCVILLDDDPERTVIGSKVRVRSGDLRQYREVRIENGYVSQATTELHFGLGSSTSVDEVSILWPDSTELVVENWGINNCLVASHLRRNDGQ